jgi:ketosteroid isomerase-like protein
MSEENVEVVKRAIEAFNAHNVEQWLSFLAPEFEFVDHMGAVAEERGSGLDAIRRQVEGWFEAFPDFRASVEEWIDAGDRVVSVTTWQGTGAGSDLPYHQEAAEVTTVRGGAIVYVEMGFADRATALEAAGLSE